MKCGVERGEAFFARHRKQCRICQREKTRKHHRTASGRYGVAKAIAKRRKWPFTLTREQYAELISRPCHYCGGILSETGVGLDRLESSWGYETFNVVPCCPECNRIRSDSFTYAEMVELGAVIAAIRNRRTSAEGPPTCGWGRKRLADDVLLNPPVDG